MLPSRLVTTFAYGMGGSRLRTGLGVGVPLEPPAAASRSSPSPSTTSSWSPPTPTWPTLPSCRPSATCPGRDLRRQPRPAVAELRPALAAAAEASASPPASTSPCARPASPTGRPCCPGTSSIGVAQAFDFSGPPKTVTRTVTLQRTVEKDAPAQGGLRHRQGDERPGRRAHRRGAWSAWSAETGRGSPPTSTAASPPRACPPGPVKLEVSAPSFETQVLEARVMLGETTEIQASLRPSLPPPRIEGRVPTPAIGRCRRRASASSAPPRPSWPATSPAASRPSWPPAPTSPPSMRPGRRRRSSGSSSSPGWCSRSR